MVGHPLYRLLGNRLLPAHRSPLVSAATGAHKCSLPRVRASFAGPWETPAVLYGPAWRVAPSVDAIQLCSTAG